MRHPLRGARYALVLPLVVAFAVLSASVDAKTSRNAPPPTPTPSLYSGPLPAPGPAILYEPPLGTTAPQLQNTGIWTAPPILISGASAYRDGEYLYQDFLFDDSGASELPDPQDPRAAGNLFSRPNGTYTYPTDPAYANNAADLVEFRVKPTSGATAFRITMNSMNDPALIGISIAIGTGSSSSHRFPFGANVNAPADMFLTIFPSGGTLVAQLQNAVTGKILTPAPTVNVDTTRSQIEVLIPASVWNPSGKIVRLAAGVGLWNSGANSYLLPTQSASSTQPGGAGTASNPAAFFNVAFRFAEPSPDPADLSETENPAWWRDRAQANALALNDISPFAAFVDFNKLASKVDDESGVPQTGPMDRIYASRTATGVGENFATSCFPSNQATCAGEYIGPLQPYAIYVPNLPRPTNGYGMTLLLHALSANYNQYLTSRNQSQLGDRGAGSIVITPEARGPDGFYTSLPGVETFEVWADVASHYLLNPDWTVITGYSMGGIGTFKLGEQFPDLFAKAESTVGDSNTSTVPSLRNVPVLMWNMAVDELVPAVSYLPTAMALDSAGYPYELDVFTPGEHLTLAVNDQFAPVAAFLGTTMVNRNPPHVTYVYDPALDYPNNDFVADHAYWLSNLSLRSTATATGTVDALSHGFGVGDPTPSGTQHGAGTLTGGNLPALAFVSQFQTLGPAPAIPVEDVIDLTTTNIATVSINPDRAAVDCNATINITSDGPIAVTLAGCNRVVQGP